MSSVYVYVCIILMVYNNMIENIGPAGDKEYFSAIFFLIGWISWIMTYFILYDYSILDAP